MKKIVVLLTLVVCTLVLIQPNVASRSSNDEGVGQQNVTDATGTVKEIYFAGGCFWGTEHLFQQVRGVTATAVGYANGKSRNPDYKTVSRGNSGFAETVKVVYDPSIVSLALLIDLYFESVDPSSLNKQGNDIGSQYRTGIYYTDKADAVLIQEKIKALAATIDKPVVIEQKALENFYTAEDYHQDYLNKNPGGYCHISPGLFKKAREVNSKNLSPHPCLNKPLYRLMDNYRYFILFLIHFTYIVSYNWIAILNF